MLSREDLFITSKIWNTFHEKKFVRKAIETTLKNLKLEYLDLYLIHWPMGYKEGGDELFPVDKNGEFIDSGVDYVETYKALEELVDLGLTRSIGVSNFNKRQIDRVLANGKFYDVNMPFFATFYAGSVIKSKTHPNDLRCNIHKIYLFYYSENSAGNKSD